MANDGKRLSPSLSQVNRRGKSPCDTPQTVRVRIFSAKSVLNAKGSITGGTFFSFNFISCGFCVLIIFQSGFFFIFVKERNYFFFEPKKKERKKYRKKNIKLEVN